MGSGRHSKIAEGSAALLHKIAKPTMWRGGVQIVKEVEEDARLLDRCEAKRKEWAGSVAEIERRRLGQDIEIVQDKNRSGM